MARSRVLARICSLGLSGADSPLVAGFPPSAGVLVGEVDATGDGLAGAGLDGAAGAVGDGFEDGAAGDEAAGDGLDGAVGAGDGDGLGEISGSLARPRPVRAETPNGTPTLVTFLTTGGLMNVKTAGFSITVSTRQRTSPLEELLPTSVASGTMC